MHLSFHHPHASIRNFPEIDLPDFTVVTGLNGAGKSHLLQAILKGCIKTPFNAQTGDIALFTRQNMEPHSSYKYESKRELPESYKNTYDYFKNQSATIQSQSNLTKSEKSEKLLNTATEDDRKRILEISQKAGRSAIDLTYDDFLYYSHVDWGSTQFFNHLFHNFFGAYRDQYLRHQLRAFQTIKKNNQLLDNDFEEKFHKEYGPPPWDCFNDILEEFNFDFKITSPSLIDYSNYVPTLIKKQTNAKVKFEELSSGEMIIICLCFFLFSSRDKRQSIHLPKLVLLDEIDASLHPSMNKKLIDFITNELVPNDIKVIATTHSPATIALAPESSIFVMRENSPNRIESRSKTDALEILSEGYVTLEQGIKIYDEIARNNITLLSEGNNISYIKKALEIFDIKGVEIIEEITDRSGSNHLRTLYDFFSRVTHKNKVIIIWDCDVGDKFRKLERKNNTIPYVFEKNELNTICTTGIENLFREELFDGFTATTTYPNHRKAKTTFMSEEKKRFEEFILRRNKKEDFQLFKPLMDTIKHSN